MDSTELQSDSLEAKGRDELITIATALGGKPASRARKAEIVELILDLASGGTSSTSTSKTEESEKETATSTSDQEATTEDQEEPPADWEVALKNEVEEESKDEDSSKSVKPETSNNTSSS